MTLDIPPGSGDEMLTRSLTALENIAGSFPVRLPIAISGLFTALQHRDLVDSPLLQ